MAWSSTDRTSSGWLDVASTVMREKRVPWYSPRTRTLTSANSRPRLRTTCATASAKHAPSEASSSSVGFGPVSVPPAVVGSSTSTSKPRTGTRHRCPPSHEAVISSMASESSPPAPPGPLSSPLPEQVRAVNVGLSLFGEALRAQGAEAMDVDWRIPARGQPSLVGALTRLYGRHAERVDQANREAVRRLDEGVAVLVEVGPAADPAPRSAALVGAVLRPAAPLRPGGGHGRGMGGDRRGGRGPGRRRGGGPRAGQRPPRSGPDGQRRRPLRPRLRSGEPLGLEPRLLRSQPGPRSNSVVRR